MIQNPEYNIYIIDDDESVRRAISLLLSSAGYHVESFENMKDFLANDSETAPGCILLDIFLEKESGLELLDAIKERFSNLPIIYITGHGDIEMSVKALKKGALNFLQKPVDDQQLFLAVEEALKISLVATGSQKEKNFIIKRFGTLTPRQLEIFNYVLTGMLNKQIASELNIAEHTVKLHRGKITEKLGVKSVPEMIYMAEKLNLR